MANFYESNKLENKEIINLDQVLYLLPIEKDAEEAVGAPHVLHIIMNNLAHIAVWNYESKRDRDVEIQAMKNASLQRHDLMG